MHRIRGYLFAFLAPFASLAANALTQDEAAAFVSTHMPPQDRGIISTERVREEARQALAMRGRFAWSEAIPDDIYVNDVVPYAVLNETRGDWRATLAQRYAPIVASCRTAREAVWRIVSGLGKDTGVQYSVNRRRAVMSPLEALREKKVSCTGQSILTVCALRSVGIPARAAGVATWNHIRGNHTWAEAWYEGRWHMVEFNEKEENTPWVMENIGLLDPGRPEQRIVASSWKPAGATFPAVERAAHEGPVHGCDATSRYMALARAWYERSGLNPNCRRLFVDTYLASRAAGPARNPVRIPLHILVVAADGSLVAEGESPGEHTDMRQYLNLTIPRQPGYRIEARRGGKNGALLVSKELPESEAPSQVVSLPVSI